MWILGLLVGLLYGYAYRLDSIGFIVLLIALALQFFLHCTVKSQTFRIFLWFLFGMGFYGVSLSWIGSYISTEYQGTGVNLDSARLIVLIILSLSYTLVPILSWRLSTRATLVVLPISLFFLNLASEHSVYSFPWLLPAYLLVDFGINHWFYFLGAFGVSFLVYLLVSFSIYCLLLVNQQKLSKAVWAIFSTLALASVLHIGSSHLHQNNQGTETLAVKVIHGQFDSQDKLSKNRVIDRFHRYASLSLQFPTASLVVWPESSVSYPFKTVEQFLAHDIQRMSEGGITTVWGGQWEANDSQINAVFSNREAHPFYIKHHLVPFGEYIPRWFSYIADDQVPLSGSTAKSSEIVNQLGPQELLRLAPSQVRAAVAVCYEALFSDVFSEKLKNSDGSLLILMSDLEWLENHWLKVRLLDVARARAAEVNKPLLYSSNQGITSIVGPNGTVVKQVLSDRTQALNATIFVNNQQSFYTKHEYHWLMWLCGLVVFIAHINRYLSFRSEHLQVFNKIKGKTYG
ncbi:apolipoprotein N-acyltransferase [Vibrio sonorensis]|uniref:apolipoprotein N-acyltransferase n=1 Tax=Vibrio sonorensis TaxID=1004316 RepID=UPI0008DA53A8|nr:apolipoprotein N-acyltransferase [Vibrio sonorensis]